MKKSSYMDRAMKSRDPRYAKILGKLGYSTRHMVPEEGVVEGGGGGGSNVIQPVVIDPNSGGGGGGQSQQTNPPTEEEVISGLRTRYKEVIGRTAYHGWDADTLRRKINEAGQ